MSGLHPIVLDTFKRIDAKHDRRWRPLADNDQCFDSDAAYFQRLRDALHRQNRGDD